MSIEISPYCSAAHSLFYTADALKKDNTYLYRYYNNVPSLLSSMKNCFQFKEISIYDHGILVANEYANIISSLELGIINEILPIELITLYKKYILLDYGIMLHYHVMHDCGKVLCKTIDSEGKQHFPNHSEISYNQFKVLYPNNVDEAFMILHDMDFHTLKNDQLIDLVNSKYGFSLYITSWAELISNSKLFGGFESVSFKIKKKKLLKCLKLFEK